MSSDSSQTSPSARSAATTAGPCSFGRNSTISTSKETPTPAAPVRVVVRVTRDEYSDLLTAYNAEDDVLGRFALSEISGEWYE